MATGDLRFLQVNLQHSKAASATMCRRFDMEGIDIALLQEPWLFGNKVAGLKPHQGKLLYSHKAQRPRACIVYSNRVNLTLLPVLCTDDIVTGVLTANTREGTRTWIVCSAYMAAEAPCPPGILEEVVEHCGRTGKALILGCDANAHHTAWGSSNINTRGESLLSFTFTKGLSIGNVGNEPTFVTRARREVLDVTLFSAAIGDNLVNWHVSGEPSNSDHRHIRFNITTSLQDVTFRNPRETNWEGYKESLNESLQGEITPIREVVELERAVDQVSNAIRVAFQENCPLRIKRHGGAKANWWNAGLQKLRSEVRRLFNKAKEDQDWETYRSKLTQYNTEIRKSKRKAWRKFCEEVSDTPACSRIHKVLAKDGCTVKEVGFIKKEDGNYTNTLQESLEELLKAHFPASTVLGPQWRLNVPAARLSRPSSEEWKRATEITRPHKIRWAITKFQPFKSPGPDSILPILLQRGLDILTGYLCRIFKACLAWGYIPMAWRSVRVVFLPKVGRSTDFTPKSYRPISLSSFLLKTLERLVDRYIRDDILKISPLSNRQYAYQPGRSTDQALDDLNRLISKSLEDKEIATATFIDIEGAFNNATTNSLVEALSNKSTPTKLCQWVRASLETRVIISTLGEASIEAMAGGGCPQGGVLSPLLWSILIDGLINRMTNEGFYCLGYADDIAVVVKGRFASVVSERTQRAINIIQNWCVREKLNVNPKKTQIVPFTRKRALGGLRPPILGGVKIPFVTEAKYLGVLFDHRMTWNTHISKTITKATISLGRCRRLCGKNWGLNPKMTLWLYTAVVRPMIAYGAVVWWTKMLQTGSQRRMESVQRLACLSVTGAMSTTPTAALEVIVGLPPLQTHIIGVARSVTYRLMHTQKPINKMHGKEYQRLTKELEADPILGMPGDAMVKRYNFQKKFTVTISDHEGWREGIPIQASSTWFTDGSKTSEGVGAGIYGIRPKRTISFNLSKDATVFQAEVAAIRSCAEEIIRQEADHGSVAIFSDSQGVLRALDAIEVDSHLVWDCIRILNNLGSRRKVTLAWVPGHKGHRGNEEADKAAKQGATTPFIGPEPYCGIARSVATAAIRTRTLKDFKSWWDHTSGQRQAKLFITEFNAKFTTKMVSLSRSSIRIIVGLLTGHCRLRRHMSILGLTDEPLCRLCQIEEETPFHVLTECSALARKRFQLLGNDYPDAKSYMDEPPTKLIALIKGTRLEEGL